MVVPDQPGAEPDDYTGGFFAVSIRRRPRIDRTYSRRDQVDRHYRCRLMRTATSQSVQADANGHVIGRPRPFRWCEPN